MFITAFIIVRNLKCYHKLNITFVTFYLFCPSIKPLATIAAGSCLSFLILVAFANRMVESAIKLI